MPPSPVVAKPMPSIVRFVTAAVFPTTSGTVPLVPTAIMTLLVPPSELALSANPSALGAPLKLDQA